MQMEDIFIHCLTKQKKRLFGFYLQFAFPEIKKKTTHQYVNIKKKNISFLT